MEKYNLPKGWKYEVFDKIENPIAKYYSALTDYGDMIKFSDITHPKTSNMFAEFDDYINIAKQDLGNITFEQLLLFLKNIKPRENLDKTRKVNVNFTIDKNLYEQFKRVAQKDMRKYSNIVEGSIRRYIQSKT